MRLILVRHGETIWNREFRYQGWSDIELSDLGLKQAELLATRFKDEKVGVLYTSNLRRAYHTAEIIARRHSLEVIRIPEIKEMNYGLWEGLTLSEIEKDYGELFASWIKDPLRIKIPKGENLLELEVRVIKGIEEIFRRHPQGTVIIVAHGGPLRIIICRMLGLDLTYFRKFKQDMACVDEIELYEDTAILALLNDTSHLKFINFSPESL